MCDKRQVIEEPCEAKVSRTVLESGGSREGVADFNQKCLHIGTRNNKSFKCENCGNNCDADYNGAKMIELWGCSVNQPRGSELLSCDINSRATESLHLPYRKCR